MLEKIFIAICITVIVAAISVLELKVALGIGAFSFFLLQIFTSKASKRL